MSEPVPGFTMGGLGAGMGGGAMDSGGGGGSVGGTNRGINLTPPDDRYYAGFTSAKDGKTYGPRLIQTAVAFSLYGIPIPRSFGTRRVPGNIIAAKNLQERRVVNGNVITYEYYATFAISCGYPSPDLTIDQRQVIRAWADGRLQVDNRSNSRQVASGFFYRFYPGTETQMPDPVLELIFGAGMVPAFRGQMYGVVVDLPLKDYNNKIPEITFEIGDLAEIDQVTTVITATDDIHHDIDQVIVDWNRMTAWCKTGTSATNSIMNEFNVAQATFTQSAAINKTAMLEDGKGFGHFGGYIPWLNRAIGIPWLPSISCDTFLFDPHVGVITHHCKADQIRQACAARCNTVDGDYTYIFILSGFDNIEILQFDPDGNFTNIGVHNVTWTSNTLLSVTPGESTQSYCTFYFCDDSSNQVHKLKLTPSLIGSGDLIGGAVFTTNAVAYDGVASTYVRNLHYTAIENCLFIFYNNGEARKYDLTDLANAWRLGGADILPDPPTSRNLWLSDITAGTLAFVRSNGDIVEINTVLGTWDTFDSSNTIIDNGSEVCDSRTRTCVGLGSGNHRFAVVRYAAITDARILVTDIMRAMANFVGYADIDLNIDAAILDEVDGAIIEQYQTLSEFLEPIKTIYGFEIIESGSKLKISNKAKLFTSVDYTVNASELIVRERGADAFRLRREEEGFHPHAVSVTYINKEVTYHWDTQTVSRNRTDTFETNESGTSTTFKLPFIMSAVEAKYAAYRVLYNPWEQRATQAFTLPPKYLTAEPGDVLDITVKGYNHRLKLIETTKNLDWTVDVAAQTFQQFENFPIDAFSGTEYEPEVPPVTQGSVVLPFEVPVIWDEDDITGLNPTNPKAIIYYVVLPDRVTDDFGEGAQAFMAVGEGVFKPLKHQDEAVPYGMLTEVVSRPHNPFSFDDTSRVNVRVIGGDATFLATLSDTDFLAGGNLALIGRHGHWELIQFRDVVQESDGSYTLTHLLRGLRGTDWILTTPAGVGSNDQNAMFNNDWTLKSRINFYQDASGVNSRAPYSLTGKLWGARGATDNGSAVLQDETSALNILGYPTSVVHPMGDLFVLLNRDWTFPAYCDLSNLGKLHRFRSIVPGQKLGGARTYGQYLNAISLSPYPVQNAHAKRDDDGKLTISWERRHRLSAPLHDGNATVPLGVLEKDDFIVCLYRLGGTAKNWGTGHGDYYQQPNGGLGRTGALTDFIQPLLYKRVSGHSASWTYLEIYAGMINAEVPDNAAAAQDGIIDIASGDPGASLGMVANLTNVTPTWYQREMSYSRVLVSIQQVSNLPDLVGLPENTVPPMLGVNAKTVDSNGTVVHLTDADLAPIKSDAFYLRFGPYNPCYIDVEDI